MVPMHVSNEESVNAASQLATEGGTIALRVGMWIGKKTVKGTVKGVKHILDQRQKSDAVNEFVKDACSAYRGGFIKNASDPDVTSMMNDLAGNGSEKIDGRFFFTGNESDLSYFWRRADSKSACIMPRSLIEDIDDPKLKSDVNSMLTKARMDGYVIPTQDAYVITPKGEKLIYDTDFIADRLKKEVSILSDAGEQIKEDRINAALKARGIDPAVYDGYDRATVNKKMLKIGDTDTGDVKYYVPGTKRKLTVEIPKKDTLDIDGQTEGIFLDPQKDYKVTENGGPSRMIKGDELFTHFDDKNVTEKDIDAAFTNQSVPAENSVISSAIEDIDADYYAISGGKLTERDGKYILSDEHNGLVTKTEFAKENIKIGDDGKAVIRVGTGDSFNTSMSGFADENHGKMKVDSIGVKNFISSAGGKKLTDGAKQFTDAGLKAAKKTEKAAEKVVVTTSKTAAISAQAAAKAVDTAGTTVGVVASAIPPVGIISTILKVVCKAAAVTAKTGAKTVSAGAKGVEAANKTKNLEHKL